MRVKVRKERQKQGLINFKTFLNLAMWIVFGVGIAGRMLLAIKVPIWSDEAYSLQISQANTIKSLFAGVPDNAHPPGYYALVNSILFLGDKLVLIRAASILAYVINSYLMLRIFGYWAVIMYATSGFFLVLDWQARAYTLILFFILLVLKLYTHKDGKRDWLILVVNTLGLCFDYSFFWFYAAQIIFLSWEYVKGKEKSNNPRLRRLFLVLISSQLFLFLYPGVWQTLLGSISYMSWTRIMFDYKYAVPYFLGSLNSPLFTAIFMGLAILGLWKVVRKRSTANFLIGMAAGVGLLVTIIITVFVSPIFHVRNLLVVGFFLVVLTAYGAERIVENNIYKLVALTLLMLINLTTNVRGILYGPINYGIEPFFWRNLISKNSTLLEGEVLGVDMQYLEPNDETNLYLWSLLYTLSGKDGIDNKKIEYLKMDEIHSLCTVVNAPLYKCRL